MGKCKLATWKTTTSISNPTKLEDDKRNSYFLKVHLLYIGIFLFSVFSLAYQLELFLPPIAKDLVQDTVAKCGTVLCRRVLLALCLRCAIYDAYILDEGEEWRELKVSY